MHRIKHLGGKEHGQSLVEVAVIFPFLLLLLLGAIEIAQAFNAYIALINSAREGASYATLYPEVVDCTTALMDEDDGTEFGGRCFEYSERIKGEALANKLDLRELSITKPTASKPFYANCPITATVAYSLTTFSSTMSLPLFGRMGLPNKYLIRYSVGMPIREAEQQACLPS
ncbi:MAG: pilus assembly protein [Anaerolineae bacterium]|nr:pilus assembly protein [Anaerolineae bacterium]